MRFRPRLLLLLAPALVALAATSPARGALVLSFNQSSYTVTPNGTVAVEVLLTQNASGTQVTPSNPLISAGVQVTYDPALVSVQSISGGPSWDFATGDPGSGTATLALDSLITGVGIIPSSGLLLGTFTFRGMAIGSMTLIAETLTPGPSFVTTNGDFLDPTNGATATLTVVPEPSSALLVVVGVGGVLGLRRYRRTATRA